MALDNGRLRVAYVKSFFQRSSDVIGQNLSDGKWHRLQVNATSGNVVIEVDSYHTVLAPPRGSQPITDLENTLYMGGLLGQFSVLGIALNNKLTTFSGCSKNVVINGNLSTFETAQRNGGYSLPKSSCKKDENCAPDSCANEGTCDATWTGFECRCLDDFVGSQCQNGEIVLLITKWSPICAVSLW